MSFRRAAALRREWMLAGLAAVLVWLLWATGGLDPLERPVSDLLLRVPRPGSAAVGPIAAVVIDEPSIAQVGPLPWSRDALAGLVRAVRRSGARAVVVDLILSEPSGEASDAPLAGALEDGPAVLAAVIAPDGGWLLPLERFGGARRAAHAHAEVAHDGVVREIAATKQAGGLSLPALSAAAARLAGWKGAIVPGGSLRPDFREPPQGIPRLSAATVMAGALPGDPLAGKVVMIGLAASGAGDQFVVPVGPRDRPQPGVLVHAAAASSIVRGGLLSPAPGWMAFAAALLAAGLVQGARTLADRLDLRLVAAVLAAALVAAVALLWAAGIVLPLVTVVAAAGLSAAGREALESREAHRETAAVLASLLDQSAASTAGPLPRGVPKQLQLARCLQREIARDGELRRALLEGLEEGVVLWDDSGRPLLANRAVERMWGEPPLASEVAAGAVERGGRHIEIAVRPISSGAVGLLRDVTAERELERSQRETQRLVSHELKTPLASIAGFGSMLERYELDRDEQLRVAGLIRGEADRLGRMVTTFLELERLGSGQRPTELRRLDLAELVSRRCDALQAAATGVTIALDSPGPAMILGDEELVVRLVDNLVGNALKHSPAGGVVEVTVTEVPEGARLSVRDRGPGIPEEALPRLFERFYRVPGSGAPGTGLGLALVREVADRHRAEVRVDTVVGRGSTFTVDFPPAGERSEADASETAGR
ncbi:MAG TPA: CHASE2 domain-containing protein [Thermoanaerobaculales bacterium]|nr:CHASE2 domain-containing protein [Thermoanaerobaculales bacterium]HQL29534.1 CHASE2 domain-containing protein [Thermoanaerobaculales bacterium]HQN95936.1 CHASE2 domain-containing protein [Thermoanaerobaculales bacterium]HQP93691.1 CHASE2 domain-containing protein [Thermoanaerobaculia bacterium]